jgi:hypothetical protein
LARQERGRDGIAAAALQPGSCGARADSDAVAFGQTVEVGLCDAALRCVLKE